MSTARAIYRAKWVLGFKDGAHRLIEDGEVEIDGRTVAYVGPRRASAPDGVAVRDFPEGMLLPGFISSHAHLCSHVGDRMMADTGRHDLFSCGFLNYLPAGKDGANFLAPEDPEVGIRYAIGELLKSGVTTVVEMGGEVGGNTDIMVDIAGEMGIRGYLAPGYASAHYHYDTNGRLRYEWLPDDGEAQFETACEAAARNNGKYDDRIRGILVPVEAVLTSRRLLRRTREEATRLGLPITLHVAETIWEFHETVRREGNTPLGVLAEEGFLGPDVILGHMLFYGGHSQTGFPRVNDLELIAESGAHVSHSPFVFSRRGISLEGFRSYTEHGINITIGTDSYPQDMFNEMKFASILGKIYEQDFKAAPARDVLNAATINGAKALGRTDIGQLSPGAKADLLVVDMGRYAFGPMLDPIKSMIHIGNSQCVEHVMVDGRVVVEDGRLTMVDEDALLAEVRKGGDAVYRAYPDYDFKGRPAEAIAPPAFAKW
ncbi:amidohydrolase family protein [Acuticoccus kandeliae]|uniref:amidohydrolase family protein n=1 Tax=Acuticoccus kandeliae TaxID=2073160 RepID=UPI001300B7BA|nr:amidohydrolase family protein [Acuticoccus kandeliae]